VDRVTPTTPTVTSQHPNSTTHLRQALQSSCSPITLVQRTNIATMATLNWRTINIDALDPDSPANFDLSTLTPAVAPVSTADVQALATQIRQLSRGGDSEGALQGALENPPYGADERGKVRCYKLPRLCPPAPPTRPCPQQRESSVECLSTLRHITNTIATVAAASGLWRPGCCFIPLYEHTERGRQG
jgi:hypothetical protein